jgi:polyhydroxyalkanoate synthesis regulator phasin
MTNTEIIKKTLEYNRVAFENVFKTVSSVQEEGRKVAGEALEKATFIPEEGKKVVHQWLEASKEAGERFRESVLKGHEQIEKYLEKAA